MTAYNISIALGVLSCLHKTFRGPLYGIVSFGVPKVKLRAGSPQDLYLIFPPAHHGHLRQKCPNTSLGLAAAAQILQLQVSYTPWPVVE